FSSSIKSTIKSGEMKQALKELKCRNEDELYQYIGSGKYTVQNVIEYIPTLKASQKEDELKKKIEEVDTLSKKLSKSARRKSNKDNAVIVDGMDDVLVRMARCCNPIPGDPILGFVTRGRGITVHKEDCGRIELDMSRRIHVEWNSDFSFKHPVNVRIITNDKPGILSTISKAINNIGVNIRSALAKSLQDRKGSFVFEIEVKDYSELLKTISAIEAIEEVITVTRA
ncbi:MAG: bifunctional (p)ppGpp synthetase/guanosine-3',5'-bis(diphosphate) 3'-pyrophosphohydrolase, partial [Bdellovibrionales bacterium]|nr:bifunctional (p)ppGpp synthetase/guanosine-3',5'-bis(diphosphate) 3'-pyrophosphohydrolase [Bdellovibrionales bacterium]